MRRAFSVHRSLSTALAAATVVTLSGVAAAQPPFVNLVPNASDCTTCHTSPPQFNAFGMDVAANLSGGEPDWSAVWNLDSDGDGQTNGEELGDPCGVWTVGDTPARTTDISAPGDANDTSADPNTPSCTTGSGGSMTGGGGENSGTGGSMTGGGGDSAVGMAGDGALGAGDNGGDSGGCSCTTVGGTSPTSAAWAGLSALFALAWLRRRR